MEAMIPRPLRTQLKLTLALAVLALASCGGGDGDSGNPPPPAPSSLSYPAPPTFVVGQSIASMSPTVTGTVASYTVSPALSAGLSINATSGVISGTPTAPAAQTTYTVTASNAGGSTTANLAITVNDVPPNISYPSTAYTLTSNVPINQIGASNQGGTVLTWSIAPTLPAGLEFDATSGAISGTALAASAAATYTITATNSGGSSQTTLTIQIDESLLLDLGHASSVSFLRTDGSRVLSRDSDGRWLLWNVDTGRILERGNSECTLAICSAYRVDMRGGTVVTATSSGLQVRAASDGHIIATIAEVPAWWDIATDGSYVVTGTASALTAWSPTGTELRSQSGDYSNAKVHAAPGEIRVALGPAGIDVVETLSVSTTARTVSTQFAGQFHSWFTDGERFLSTAATTVFVYSKTAVQEDLAALPSVQGLTGQGSWVSIWRQTSSQLSIYRVGALSSPPSTFTANDPVFASGTTIGIRATSGVASASLTVVDLSGPTITSTAYTLPIYNITQYAAVSASQWIVGNEEGVILDGAAPLTTPKYLGHGKLRSMAGSEPRLALATSTGSILYFDMETKTLEGSFDLSSSQVALSTSGTVLTVNLSDMKYHPNRALKIFSLPSEAEIHSWPYLVPVLVSSVLSGDGTVLGQRFRSTGSWTRSVNATTGGPDIFLDHVGTFDPAGLSLSPNGTLIAVEVGNSSNVGVNILRNGALVTTIAGPTSGWIDNSRLLVNIKAPDGTINAYIYSAEGMRQPSPAFPQITSFQTVSGNRIYVPATNVILSLDTGEVVWQSANPGGTSGVVAGGYVVYNMNQRIIAEPY